MGYEINTEEFITVFEQLLVFKSIAVMPYAT